MTVPDTDDIMSTTANRLPLQKVLSIPETVDSHAIAQQWGDELWLLINKPGTQKTQLYKINTALKVNFIAVLPILSSTLSCCSEQMLVTGSNKQGQAVVIGVDALGQVKWQYVFSGSPPIIWPVAACGEKPMVAWQTTANEINWGLLDTESSTMDEQKVISIESSPVKLFSWKDRLWVIWMENSSLKILDLYNAAEKAFPGTNTINEFSMGVCTQGVYFGCISGDNITLHLPANLASSPVYIDSDPNGTFDLISGDMPLIWSQQSRHDIDGNRQWKSTLTQPDSMPFYIDDFVFTVAFWEQQIVVVQRSSMLIIDN